MFDSLKMGLVVDNTSAGTVYLMLKGLSYSLRAIVPRASAFIIAIWTKLAPA